MNTIAYLIIIITLFTCVGCADKRDVVGSYQYSCACIKVVGEHKILYSVTYTEQFCIFYLTHLTGIDPSYQASDGKFYNDLQALKSDIQSWRNWLHNNEVTNQRFSDALVYANYKITRLYSSDQAIDK